MILNFTLYFFSNIFLKDFKKKMNLELHSYDGKTIYKVNEDRINLSDDIKKKTIKEYIESISDQLSPFSKMILHKMYEEIDNSFDDKNDVSYMDLLYDCTFHNSQEFIQELNFQ